MSDWFDANGAGKAVDVTALMDSGVPAILWTIIEAGALVSIGRTSDGGALGITVTMDGRWRREYFRDADDAVDWLLGAAAAVSATRPTSAASSAPRNRKRGSRAP